MLPLVKESSSSRAHPAFEGNFVSVTILMVGTSTFDIPFPPPKEAFADCFDDDTERDVDDIFVAEEKL